MKMTPQLAEQIKGACFLVVDTNAWITSLDAVLSLKNYPQLTVIVPSAVIQELDGLKQDQEQLGTKARLAIKVIYDATTNGEAWIRGQRYDEHLGSAVKIDNKDDEILSCALFFHTRVSPSVLITGDYGLALKATINRVPTTDMRGLLESLPVTSMFSSFSPPAVPSHQTRPNHTNPHQPTSQTAVQRAPKRKADDLALPAAPSPSSLTTTIAKPTLIKRRRTAPAVDIPGLSFTSSPQQSDDEDDMDVGQSQTRADNDDRQPAADRSEPQQVSLLSLPTELQSKVLAFVPPRALLRVEEVASSLRCLLSPVASPGCSADIWSAALRRSHGRATNSYGGRHPKHAYLAWRRSVVPPKDLNNVIN